MAEGQLSSRQDQDHGEPTASSVSTPAKPQMRRFGGRRWAVGLVQVPG